MLRTALLMAAASITPFSLKGWHLGQDIEEIRSAALPDTERGPSHFECSDNSTVTELQPEDILAKTGVVRCHAIQQISSSKVFASIKILGDIPVYADFFFLNRKLYEIEVYTDRSNFNDILTALTQKYGQPTSMQTSTFQVGSGATFPQQIVKWRQQGQTISLTSPDDGLNILSLVYSDDASLATIDAARAAQIKKKNDL